MAKDIILIFPPISVSERYSADVGEVGGHLPPLSLASIAAVLEKNGIDVEIIDGPASRMSMAQIAESVKKQKPLAVGISCLTGTANRSVAVAEKIKEVLPETKVIAGGQHITIMGEKIFSQKTPFDVLVCGEGETTILELMKLIKKRKFGAEELKRVDGLIFKDGNRVVQTKPRALMPDLDSLPFPAYHLLPMDKYVPLPNQYKRKPVASVVAIRGCPYQCTYCSASAVFGRKCRSNSPEYVYRELKYLKDDFGIREVCFWDDTLTVNRGWLMKLCGLMIENRLDLSWSCYGRVNTVDLELLKKMKAAGCWNIFYGLESGNQESLDLIKKGITLDQTRKAVKWTQQAGIEARGSFMIALPGETPEMARKTIRLAIELDLDYAQFCITTPFPGTELFGQAKKYGRLKLDFDEYSIWNPVFVPHGYKDADEVNRMYKEAFRRFYVRPRYVLKRMLSIRSLEDIKRNINGLRLLLGFTKNS